MTTTAEYWDVEGTDLANLAYNIDTLGGRYRIGVKRGDNVKVGKRGGTIWVPKYPDEGQVRLAMWVRGAGTDGSIPAAGTDKRAQFNYNWRKLARLFSIRTRLISVTKRWYDYPTGAPPVVLMSATAMCEVRDVVEPSMLSGSNWGARMMVTLNIPGVFFFGTVVNPSIPIAGTTGFDNVGDDIASAMVIRFNGPLTNPTLTNTSADPDVWVKFGGTLGGGEWVDLDTEEFTAIKSDGSNVIGAISHSGSPSWLQLLPGTNTLDLTADSGSGTVGLTLRPPYW